VKVTPAGGMFQRGRRDWPRKSGGCRPEDSRRPGAHHRPRGKGGALPGRVLLMRNTTIPLGSGGLVAAGGPTVREAEFRSGRRMTQEANAGGRKGGRKPGPRAGISAGGSRITGRIRDRCPARKGADVGQVSL